MEVVIKVAQMSWLLLNAAWVALVRCVITGRGTAVCESLLSYYSVVFLESSEQLS